MLTAVDTPVLLDVFGADPHHGATSSAALNLALAEGGVIACDVVWAETRALFPSETALLQAMSTVGIGYSTLNQEAALMAGAMWQKYRETGGKRSRMVADFMIASHASRQCDRLLTRDRGFYRDYFKGLKLLDPANIK
jgi:hypothetical protein